MIAHGESHYLSDENEDETMCGLPSDEVEIVIVPSEATCKICMATNQTMWDGLEDGL